MPDCHSTAMCNDKSRDGLVSLVLWACGFESTAIGCGHAFPVTILLSFRTQLENAGGGKIIHAMAGSEDATTWLEFI